MITVHETEQDTIQVIVLSFRIAYNDRESEGGSMERYVPPFTVTIQMMKLVAEIAEKIAYCQEILPKAITEDQILEYLNTNNIEKNIGVCMKTLKTQFGSALDGKVAQGVVRQYINN